MQVIENRWEMEDWVMENENVALDGGFFVNQFFVLVKHMKKINCFSVQAIRN